MKKRLLILSLLVSIGVTQPILTIAQCSICTKTTQQLGEKPATGMNRGIIYLAFTPLAIMGVIGYKWWKKNN